MKVLRRVLLTLAITLVAVFVGIQWIAPIAVSFYSARKAPAVARIVPAELQDHSVSQTPGQKLAYFGYEFQVPWNDLDARQTKLYPKDEPHFRVDLRFHSGLRLIVTASRPGTWTDELSKQLHVPQQRIAVNFGASDYDVEKTILEFTPDKMNHWSLSPRLHGREEFLLILKSIVPLGSAESGIFNIRSQAFRGFQQGNPTIQKDGIYVHLFDGNGSVEFILVERDYRSKPITQPEINRIIESLHRVTISSIISRPE